MPVLLDITRPDSAADAWSTKVPVRVGTSTYSSATPAPSSRPVLELTLGDYDRDEHHGRLDLLPEP